MAALYAAATEKPGVMVVCVRGNGASADSRAAAATQWNGLDKRRVELLSTARPPRRCELHVVGPPSSGKSALGRFRTAARAACSTARSPPLPQPVAALSRSYYQSCTAKAESEDSKPGTAARPGVQRGASVAVDDCQWSVVEHGGDWTASAGFNRGGAFAAYVLVVDLGAADGVAAVAELRTALSLVGAHPADGGAPFAIVGSNADRLGDVSKPIASEHLAKLIKRALSGPGRPAVPPARASSAPRIAMDCRKSQRDEYVQLKAWMSAAHAALRDRASHEDVALFDLLADAVAEWRPELVVPLPAALDRLRRRRWPALRPDQLTAALGRMEHQGLCLSVEGFVVTDVDRFAQLLLPAALSRHRTKPQGREDRAKLAALAAHCPEACRAHLPWVLQACDLCVVVPAADGEPDVLFPSTAYGPTDRLRAQPAWTVGGAETVGRRLVFPAAPAVRAGTFPRIACRALRELAKLSPACLEDAFTTADGALSAALPGGGAVELTSGADFIDLIAVGPADAAAAAVEAICAATAGLAGRAAWVPLGRALCEEADVTQRRLPQPSQAVPGAGAAAAPHTGPAEAEDDAAAGGSRPRRASEPAARPVRPFSLFGDLVGSGIDPHTLRSAAPMAIGANTHEILLHKPGLVQYAYDERGALTVVGAAPSCDGDELAVVSAAPNLSIVGAAVRGVSTMPFDSHPPDTPAHVLAGRIGVTDETGTADAHGAEEAALRYPVYLQVEAVAAGEEGDAENASSEPAAGPPPEQMVLVLTHSTRAAKRDARGDVRFLGEAGGDGRWGVVAVAVRAGAPPLGDDMTVQDADHRVVGYYPLAAAHAAAIVAGRHTHRAHCYVHGFNCSFAWAACTAANYARAFGSSLMVMYSWPGNPDWQGTGSWLLRKMIGDFEVRVVGSVGAGIYDRRSPPPPPAHVCARS